MNRIMTALVGFLAAAFLVAASPTNADTGNLLPQKIGAAGGMWSCIPKAEYDSRRSQNQNFISCRWENGEPRVYIVMRGTNLNIGQLVSDIASIDVSLYNNFNVHGASPALKVYDRPIMGGRYQDLVYEYSWQYNGALRPNDECKSPDCKKTTRMDLIPIASSDVGQYIIVILSERQRSYSLLPMVELDKKIDEFLSARLG